MRKDRLMPTMGPGPWEGKFFDDEHNDELDDMHPLAVAALAAIAIPFTIIDIAASAGRRAIHRFGDWGRQEDSEK